ncbi:unnamed protein product [Periconia digitata]|uniref:Uncharacterized protein n=1 Tax=Periconia digitata TaxID=1303443 RepID=A0A9W4USG5_9PLEO|nr:unnamed protein product [Periconia digitata]
MFYCNLGPGEKICRTLILPNYQNDCSDSHTQNIDIAIASGHSKTILSPGEEFWGIPSLDREFQYRVYFHCRLLSPREKSEDLQPSGYHNQAELGQWTSIPSKAACFLLRPQMRIREAVMFGFSLPFPS